ncbi:MAG: tetratricopeptide repeat protein [Bacteroidaceae bacterium]|nr:tetratricopeptide repeat protein [Bacteroidaceae bacterium]
MRKLSIFLIVLMCTTLMSAKSYTQQGIAYLYDYKTKTKKPIANVSLTVAGAQPTVSKADGTFALVFDNYGLGDKIGFEKQPYYQGMKVFNKKEVDNWFIVKDRLRLIMCRYEEFELAKNNFYQQGLKAATEKYEKEISKIKADQELKEAEKNQQLQEAEEHLQKVMESLSETSEAMARIDQSELDSSMQEVLNLYERGDVDEALEILENLNLEEKFIQTLTKRHIGEKIVTEATEDSMLTLNKLRTSVKMYMNSGNWDRAAESLKLLADNLNTFYDVIIYTQFCSNQNNFQEAERYFNKALNMVEHKGALQGDEELWLPSLQNDLAWLYFKELRFSEAEKLYKQALENYQKLVAKNPNAYSLFVPKVLTNLAILYSETGRLTEAENMCKQTLEIAMQIKEINSMEYGTHMALTLSNIAAIFHKKGRLAEAEDLFRQALTIFSCMTDDELKEYYPNLALIMTNLAIVYTNTEQYTEAEDLFQKALKIHEILIHNNPKAYEPGIIQTLNNMGAFYHEIGRFSEAEEIFKQAMEILIRLTENNPIVYEIEIARTLNNLADLYSDLQSFSLAESMYELALASYLNLADDNPKEYKPCVSAISGKLAFCYIFKEKYSQAEQLARAGMVMDASLHCTAINTLSLAAAILFQGKFSEAESIYRQNKELLKDLFLEDFYRFKAAGVIPQEREEDVERIKKVLNE